jgi:ABC-type methionine transport system ATPase subunit
MAEVDITLTAHDDLVSQPWIWRLCRDFSMEVSIVKANVDEDFACVKLHLSGPAEEIQRATAWLVTTGVHVDAEQRAVGAV